jgi:hypothetical protein
MRQFSSPRLADLKFTMYDDGSGTAEYKGKKVGEINKNTNEIRINRDQWRTINGTDLEKEFIVQTERFVSRFEAYNYDKNILKDMIASGKIDKSSAAELLLNTDMITIAELSPFFKEDKKATISLNETTAEFLINKSPELKLAFENKGYDNYKSFFENNCGVAYIEAKDKSDIGISVVINANKEYPIPLSLVEKNIVRDRYDEEIRRRNNEDLEDKDGDHIPDRIDSTFSPEGYRTQTNYDYNENRDNEYRIALVSSDEYDELQDKGFKFQKANDVAEDGRIPIRFNATEKEKFEKIICSLGGNHGRIHV